MLLFSRGAMIKWKGIQIMFRSKMDTLLILGLTFPVQWR